MQPVRQPAMLGRGIKPRMAYAVLTVAITTDNV